MKIFFCSFFMILFYSIQAQVYCNTEDFGTHEEVENLELIKVREVVYLSVVVHVLYRNSIDSISDEQIKSQLEVLNEDFSRSNANYDSTPDIFKQVSADTEIRFCLASLDPDGSSTSGITRTKTAVENIGNTNFYYDSDLGGIDAWDQDRFINIWVADNGGEDILGEATFPGMADPPAKDGLVMNYRYFGRKGVPESYPPHDLGKSGVHEMGHYFGLPHIFGSLGTNCDDDDGFSDTPIQDEFTLDCPSFPKPDICSQGDGIMFMNYMDYTDDACLSMFTLQQKNKMWQALDGLRNGLLGNSMTQCITAVIDPKIQTKWKIFPNPADESIKIDGLDFNKSQIVKIYSISGKLMMEAEVNQSNSLINISQLESGLYFLTMLGDVKKLIVR